MPNNDRLFKMPEAKLLEHAEVVASLYPTDVVDFSAFDSTFTLEYGGTIKNSDQVVIDEMAERTQDVHDEEGEINPPSHSKKTQISIK